MSIRLGSIVVDLSANTVAFSDSMAKMSQLSLTTGRNVQRSLAMIGTAATAMAASITASLTASIAEAEEFSFSMAKMAQQTGTSVEMFSKLAYNAKLAGTPIDTVKMAMERLAKTASAAQNGQKESLAAYSALGISVKDLKGPLKDSGDLFVAVSKSLDKFAESTQKTGLEQKLLGRSGAEMAPLLKQIASGFDTASQQATLFGVVVGDKTAAQATRLHQSIIELESVALGFSLRLLNGVAPALGEVSNKIIRLVTSANGMRTIDTIAGDVATTVTGLGNAFEYLFNHANAVKGILEGMAAVKVASIFLPMIAGAAKAGVGMDTVGLVALKMIGRVTGIKQLANVLTPLAASAWGTSTAMLSLAASEGRMAAASYAAELALTPLVVTSTAVAAALATVGAAFLYEKKQAEKNTGYAVTWAETWNGAMDGVADNMERIAVLWDKITGKESEADKAFEKKQASYGKFGENMRQHIEERARADNAPKNGIIDYGNGVARRTHQTKLDAPQLPKEQTDKVDHLKLKMDELAESAKAAHQSLEDASKGLDFQRADAIAAEFRKTIIALNAELKAQHKTLSDADKAAILNSITTRVNDESQAKYREGLKRSTDEMQTQIGVQGILTRAIGEGAAATRQAAIEANAAKRDALQSDEWKRLNAGLRASEDAAFGMKYDAENGAADKLSLKSVQDQINAQLALNSAIGQGSRARQAAALAAEQDAIREKFASKGDTNQSALDAELAANEKMFQLKQAENNLNRAVSMDPARVYREQADGLEDIAKAAQAAGISISQMEMQAAQDANWDHYLESIDRTALAVGNVSDGVNVFFREMARGTESAAEQVRTVLEGAFRSLDGAIGKLIEGRRNSFSEMFRSISTDMARLALKNTEQRVAGYAMKALGIKGDPSKDVAAKVDTSNKYLETIAVNTGIRSLPSGVLGSGGVGAAGTALAGTSGTSGLMSTIGSMASLIPGLGPITSLFGGHFAGGGDVKAGMTYDIGEMGREQFTPTQDGKITPHSRLSGGSPILHIDARGSNDPAQTEAAIHRAFGMYSPHIVAAAVHATHEQNKRSTAHR